MSLSILRLLWQVVQEEFLILEQMLIAHGPCFSKQRCFDFKDSLLNHSLQVAYYPRTPNELQKVRGTFGLVVLASLIRSQDMQPCSHPLVQDGASIVRLLNMRRAGLFQMTTMIKIRDGTAMFTMDIGFPPAFRLVLHNCHSQESMFCGSTRNVGSS